MLDWARGHWFESAVLASWIVFPIIALGMLSSINTALREIGRSLEGARKDLDKIDSKIGDVLSQPRYSDARNED